jgi:Leucine-rich repeat (LRR) protein/GTPase SAR1 family protein
MPVSRRPNAKAAGLSTSTSSKKISIKDRISRNKTSLRTSLILDDTDGVFSEIPDELFELIHLKKLELREFDISSSINRFSKFSNLEELSIGRCIVGEFPTALINLPKLKKLFISTSDDKITELPAQLNNWHSLEYLGLGSCDSVSSVNGLPPNIDYLYLNGTSLEAIPDIIFFLKGLTKLVISHFNTPIIPPSIANLRNLQALFVTDSQIHDLPQELELLPYLNEIVVHNAKLKELPPVILKLKRLTLLHLSGNLLSSLPTEFSSLNNLSSLELSSNNFKEIPLSIFELTNLENLDLSNYAENSNTSIHNDITYIPIEFLKLKKLTRFELHYNAITNVPTEIVSQGINAIKSYLFQLEHQEKDYLFEAKLIILGEPGAGKTSLTRKLNNPNCRLPKPKETTKGVEVIQYRFPIDAEDFPDAIPAGQQKEFRLNMWDFGGQEIYKATHRFFLSDQAVYLLVADSRKENTDFPYWLHIEEIFGDKSPVVIVINEHEERGERDIDETELRGHFANVKDIMRVDVSERNKKRLTNIKTLVRSLAVGLPHVGNPVPANWTVIRAALEADERQWIGDYEYYDLCEANGITDNKDARILSKYFHDIGVFLHFQQDELLDKTIFLKPTWATNAVYKVLDDPLLKKRNGRFSRQEAAAIWHEKQFERVQGELLKLMQRFFLTYKVSDAAGYIVPDKLPSNRPKYDWDETNNLVLEYKYEYFMPKGLLTQFIVEQHQHITDHNLVWLRGVVLEYNGARAEVTEAYGARTIRVRIAGKRKRDFMTLLTSALDVINKQYNNLVVEKFIPCTCEKCLVEPKPHFYEFKDLQDRLDCNQETVECRKSYKHVNVRGLLDEVFNPTMLPNGKNADLATRLQVQSAESANDAGPGKIFISYSHKDDKFLKRLFTHFEVLEHEGTKLDYWADTRLVAGMRWREEIERAMQECQIAILLVSTDFLASKFIREVEMPAILAAADARGVKVVSVVVKPCHFTRTKFLQDYQAANDPDHPLSTLKPNEREKAYMAVIDQVTALLPE